jgi:hypothetical protein
MIIKNNKPVIRYIDFGLSEDINSMKHSYNNINGNGTPAYMAPDFIILNEMKKQNFNTLLHKKNIAQNIINKLFMSLKSNLSTFTNKGLNKTYLDGNMDTFTSEINFNMNSIKKESHYFFTKKDITNIYIFLLNLYKNNELLPYHFTPIIGLNPKFDIFSLGLVVFEIKKLLNIKDILLEFILLGVILFCVLLMRGSVVTIFLFELLLLYLLCCVITFLMSEFSLIISSILVKSSILVCGLLKEWLSKLFSNVSLNKLQLSISKSLSLFLSIHNLHIRIDL